MWQLIVKYSGVFFLSTVKFLFAPAAAWNLGFSFWEVFITVALGGMTGASFFYLSSNFFFERAKRKKAEKERLAKSKGILVLKRNFTRRNKLIVKIKRSGLGFYILLNLAPTFLSIPIGSLILAKFYNHKPVTYPLLLMFVVLWSFIITLLSEFLIV